MRFTIDSLPCVQLCSSVLTTLMILEVFPLREHSRALPVLQGWGRICGRIRGRMPELAFARQRRSNEQSQVLEMRFKLPLSRKSGSDSHAEFLAFSLRATPVGYSVSPADCRR